MSKIIKMDSESISKNILDDLNLENICEMANLPIQRTGLKVYIWSENHGKYRNNPDKEPRVKIGVDVKSSNISVSIERSPRELTNCKGLKQSEKNAIKKAKEYIGRNCDLFLQHYNGEIDDIELMQGLSKKGDFKL